MKSSPRSVLLALLAGLLAFAYYKGVYAPLVERGQRAEEELAAETRRLRQARTLAKLDAELRPLLRDSAADLNLVVKLEQLFGAKRLRDRVVQLRSQPPKPTRDAAEEPEESAFVLMDRMDLKQLVTALAALDELPQDVWVRRLVLQTVQKQEARLTLEIDQIRTQ